MARLLSPSERQTMLRSLKHGPNFGDREALAAYTIALYTLVTGRELFWIDNTLESAVMDSRRDCERD